MAKDKVDEAPVEAPVDGTRAARWAEFLARAEKQNPEKFAVKKAAGVFDKIPDSFV